MWLRRLQRFWKIKLALTACMLAALIVVGGRSLAQMRQAEQFDRDERRIERKFDALQKDQDGLRLDMERRLVRIETYLNALTWMLGAIGLVIVTQVGAAVGKGVMLLVAQWRATGKGG